MKYQVVIQQYVVSPLYLLRSNQRVAKLTNNSLQDVYIS